MAELRAPSGVFLLVELEPGLDRSRVNGIFHNVALLPGVHCVSDLAGMPLVFLEERILLHLDPEDWPLEYRRKGSDYNAIRKHHARKLQPGLPEVDGG